MSHYKRFIVKAANTLSFAKDFGVTPLFLPRFELECQDVEVKLAVFVEVLHAIEVTEQRVRSTIRDNATKKHLNRVEKWLKCANTAIKYSKKIWN